MEKILIVLALFLSVLGYPLECHLGEHQFEVVDQGQKKTHHANTGFAGLRYACGERLAGIYDGFDLILYDSRKGSFAWEKVNSDYIQNEIFVKGLLLTLYEGKNLVVYDGENGGFRRQAVSDYRYFRLAQSEKLAGVYDGTNVTVYDSQSGKFFVSKVSERFPYSRFSLSAGIAAFYDGGDLVIFDSKLKEFRTGFARYSVTPFLLASMSSAVLYDGNRISCYAREVGEVVSLDVPKKADVSGKFNEVENLFDLKFSNEKVKISGKTCKLL